MWKCLNKAVEVSSRTAWSVGIWSERVIPHGIVSIEITIKNGRRVTNGSKDVIKSKSGAVSGWTIYVDDLKFCVLQGYRDS